MKLQAQANALRDHRFGLSEDDFPTKVGAKGSAPVTLGMENLACTYDPDGKCRGTLTTERLAVLHYRFLQNLHARAIVHVVVWCRVPSLGRGMHL